MNELKIFENPEFGEIRTTEIDGKPYFCALDVATALGYSNGREAIKRHCRYVVKRYVPHPQNPNKQIMMSFIPEGDIFRLVVHSKLPDAERFEVWVFDDVLPTIRKTGGYIPTTPQMSDLEIVSRALLITQRTIDMQKNAITTLQNKNAVQEQIILELQPKVDYMDTILQSKSVVNINQIAKDYGMSGREMNKVLHEIGIQYKQGGQWLLYSNYQSCGYTHSETINIKHKDGTPDVKMNTKWTQKGRLFLYNMLKKHGYLPMIERETA